MALGCMHTTDAAALATNGFASVGDRGAIRADMLGSLGVAGGWLWQSDRSEQRWSERSAVAVGQQLSGGQPDLCDAPLLCSTSGYAILHTRSAVVLSSVAPSSGPAEQSAGRPQRPS